MRTITIAAWAAILLAGNAWAAPMSSYTTKATPVGADTVLVNDSEAANATKKATLSSIVALSPSMTYPGAGVPLSTGSAWGTSYTVGTSAGNLVALNGGGDLSLNTVDATFASVTVTRTTSPSAIDLYEGTGGGDNKLTLTISGNLAADVTLNADQILATGDVDDTPVNGVTTAPVSSNWAYDHVAASDPHTGYVLESAIGTTVQAYDADLTTAAGASAAASATYFGKDSGGTVGFHAVPTGGGTPTTITVADTTDTTAYVALFDSATGDLGPKTDAGITYNAGTGMLTATGFSGPLTGTASGNLVSGGAAGTPSSITLTNGTGLPISGLTGSTSTALGVGSVELGHALDTTIARSSAGVATIEGVTVTRTIAGGTVALGTSAISSGACATEVSETATGTATTDIIGWGFNSDPTSTTGYTASANGMLTIIAYPTSGNVNFKVCNNTAASITPGAITLNWKVIR